MSTKKPKTHYNYQTINGQQRYVGPDSPYRTVRPPRSVREGTEIKVGSRVRLKTNGDHDNIGVRKLLKDKIATVTYVYATSVDLMVQSALGAPHEIRIVPPLLLEKI